MRKFALFILSVVMLTLFCSNTRNNDTIPTNMVDLFLRDNPEYVAETIYVNANLPEVQLDDSIVDLIMEYDLLPKLRSYKSNSRILLSLSKFPGKTAWYYVFDPVAPDQQSQIIKILNDSIQSIIGFVNYDEVCILIDSSFYQQIKHVDNYEHNFRLKLLIHPTKDEPAFWEYGVNDSIVWRLFSPDAPNFDHIWRPYIINLFNRMAEHDF